ncbi:Putative uncharacterized protein [Moritella viscosa]|uniref:Uncharacterized protein n=1 Tax=Moritella viscosa TaxID=80854 RepID=A0A1L0CMA7_9GAMM|nr:Putative uncharacterized protein [Moritella viscosa]SHO13505.1 Putative uncharacterized protein [Moritella viscosa]SHO13507.1 Putative uncharacterized protein [Moritella viscosa]SHO17944.1 Putative uncharacterized protein [Moritella viscosa]SHO18627.1 Putative uncharacterized protein [Moritella viscosa]
MFLFCPLNEIKLLISLQFQGELIIVYINNLLLVLIGII